MESRTDHAPVTIAVVSWNTRALLAECLDSMHDGVSAGLAEVWVVDNASSDGSPELVSEHFPWVKLIESAENLGFGAAVNAVAARTRGAWIAPSNADVRLSPGALERLIAEGERHPEAGVIAPKLILPDGTTQHSVYPFPTLPFALAYAFGATDASDRLARFWGIDRGFDGDRTREVSWAVGAFMLVRRSAWEKIGGFDEAHWMYAEDLDLGWRLRRAGWITRYAPEARVHHAESVATTQAWGSARHDRWHASTYAWMARRRGLLVARLFALLNIVGFLLRALASSPGALAGNDASRRARRDALNTARAHAVGLRPRHVLERVR